MRTVNSADSNATAAIDSSVMLMPNQRAVPCFSSLRLSR